MNHLYSHPLMERRLGVDPDHVIIDRIVFERLPIHNDAPTLDELAHKPPKMRPDEPPLGLMPRWLSVEHRFQDILSAMERYLLAGKDIPQEWIEELMETHALLVELHKQRKDKTPC